jgi:ATP-dependent RNA helicase DeaD
MVWFRVDIGRERKADPRWLLPLLCRAGDVKKSEIGAIKIFDRDTRFQVAAEFADKFAEAARSMKPNEGRISRIGAFMGDDAGMRDNPTYARPLGKGSEGKAAASSDRPTDSRPKKPWQDRKKGKADGHPHRKGDAARSHPKASKPHDGSPKSHGAHKPVSKYAHKKKHHATPQT